jgi:hypothetical protein
MNRYVSMAALLFAFSPAATFAANDAVTSFTDHHLSVEKGHAVERVAREMAQGELEDACAMKGGSLVEVSYKSTPLWGGSKPFTRVQADGVCRVGDAH